MHTPWTHTCKVWGPGVRLAGDSECLFCGAEPPEPHPMEIRPPDDTSWRDDEERHDRGIEATK